MRLLECTTRCLGGFGAIRVEGFSILSLTSAPTVFDISDAVLDAPVNTGFSVSLPAQPIFSPLAAEVEPILPKSAKRSRRKLFKMTKPGRKEMFIGRSKAQLCKSLICLSLPHQKTAYQGLTSKAKASVSTDSAIPEVTGTPSERLARYQQHGYHYIPSPCGYDVPLIDGRGVVFGLIIGSPSRWKERSFPVLESLLRLRRRATGLSRTRRGDFDFISAGFSHGNGQTAPTSFRTTPNNRAALDECLSSAPVQNLLNYIQGPFRTWFPKIFDLYDELKTSLIGHNPQLWSPCSVLPFTAFTLNLGPRTCCAKHRDSSNLAAGLCLVCALGNFDHKKGGHLILHEPRLIVELAPGSAILFPSSLITHENIPIADAEEEGEEETRLSLTAYSSGALFRWAGQGYCLARCSSDGPEERKQKAEEGGKRWEESWNLFPTIEEMGLSLSTMTTGEA